MKLRARKSARWCLPLIGAFGVLTVVSGCGDGASGSGPGGTFVKIHNLTDEEAFDVFGVRRPGRAFYVKTTGEF